MDPKHARLILVLKRLLKTTPTSAKGFSPLQAWIENHIAKVIDDEEE